MFFTNIIIISITIQILSTFWPNLTINNFGAEKKYYCFVENDRKRSFNSKKINSKRKFIFSIQLNRGKSVLVDYKKLKK